MIDLNNFIKEPKSLLIAPAGFGKTHTIAECLSKLAVNSRKELILTHTHAGVGSIKEKLKKENVHKNYEVETISSFVQRYVLAYNYDGKIPNQENSKQYYSFLNQSALQLFKTNIIQKVIKASYSGLFVDEYQDCTKTQHQIIKVLADLLPTRLLGDFLQGIFEFNEPTVNLNCMSEMDGFIQNYFELLIPQRWQRGNNEILGNDLKAIREKIIRKENINLKSYISIEVFEYPSLDIHTPKTNYNKLLWKLIENNNSLLILHSNTTSVEPRKKITQKFNGALNLIESIDDKLFYKAAVILDELDLNNMALKLNELSLLLFNKTEINKWFNEKGFKRKTKLEDKTIIEKINQLSLNLSVNLHKIVDIIAKLPNVKCYRPEILSSLLKAIENADSENLTIYQSMINYRNSIRRFGRKIEGKCIGTTLLTKGLEFDTVLILDANKFTCPKHFYVAITRACKRLVIVTENTNLKF